MTLDHLYLVLGTAVINGAVTWGVVKTQLAWLRHDVNEAHKRISDHDKKHDRHIETLHAKMDLLVGRRRTWADGEGKAG